MISLLRNPIFFKVSLVLSAVFLVAICIVKGSMPILDSRFFYFQSEVQELLIKIGEEGRNRYLIITILDFLFMCFYTLMFCSGFARFFEEVEQLKIVLLLPLILYLADTFETSLIFYLLWIFPVYPPGLSTILVLATPFKWFMALATLLVFVNGYLLKKYFQKP